MKAAVWVRRIPWSIPLAAAGSDGAGAAWAGAVRGFRRWRTALSPATNALGRPGTGGNAGRDTAQLPAAVPLELRDLRRGDCAAGGVYFFRSVNGAHRWVRWGHVGLQPSEFAKLAFVWSWAAT